MSKVIVLITSGQPSANPRTIKEATALHKSGYDVTVIYTPLSPWADAFDVELFANTPGIKWIMAGKHLLLNPLYSLRVRLRRKFYEFLYRVRLSKQYEKAYILFAQELWQKAKHIKADLYVAHNLGALPIVAKASRKFKSLAAFDAEDYYRGISTINSWYHRVGIKMENYYLPTVNYVTAASPLIGEKYKELFPDKDILVINNVFDKKYLQNKVAINNKKLHLFWFSQFLGPSRGIETVIEAINLLQEFDIELHLLGECSESYKNSLTNISAKPNKLHFIQPVSLEQIFVIAAQYDIGLATEVPYNENRDICLTNKVFSYLTAGNCIIASDTLAQKQFMLENPDIGFVYLNNDANSLAIKLEILYNDRSLLNDFKKNALQLAEEKYNWETESVKLLDKIKSVVCN